MADEQIKPEQEKKSYVGEILVIISIILQAAELVIEIWGV